MKQGVAVGSLAVAFAGVYYYFTMDISRSLLADHVGADGLPKLYAVVLGLLGVLSIGQSFTARARSLAASEGSVGATPLQHVRALGLLVLGAAYLLLIAGLGYLLTITLLIAAVALYSGAAFDFKLLLTSTAGGVFFWLVFAKLFGMLLPTGTLWQGLLG